MTRRPPRFVHTSDWHLERPLSGLAEIPERLRATLIDAPYLAAARVVDTALAEDADFRLLSGDVLDVELAGPQGIAFLLDQFARLGQRGVSVYWAGGRVDRSTRWPASIKLPDNVHYFPQRRPEAITHFRDEEPLAHIVGVSRHRKGATRAGAFLPSADGLPTIAVAHGPMAATVAAGGSVNYWALGGKHGRTTSSEGPPTAHYPGTPQGRTAGEAGSHGSTVVEIDDAGKAAMRFVPADVVRWSLQPITVDPSTTREALRGLLAERLASLATGAAGVEWLVEFKVSGQGPLIASLRHGAWLGELLDELRSQAAATVWPVSLELDPAAAVPPAWLERDSLLGELLRSLGELGGDDNEAGLAARLESYLDEPRRATAVGQLVALTDDADRLRLLRQAAALAASLLGGEEVRS